MRTFVTNIHVHPQLDYHAFCQCADENSGNFYDFIPLDGSRLAISFGDLPSGGDLPYINIPCVQALVRGLAAGSREDLAGLARELNTTLYLLSPQALCAPWFYGLVDAVRHELKYVNAGHEPPLLIRKRTGTVERLERTGAPLGLSVRGLHRQQTIVIEPGDILAIRSEGVAEALSDALLVNFIRDHSNAGAAEIARCVLEKARRSIPQAWIVGDRSFAALRLLGAQRLPLPERRAEESLVMCAA